MAYCDGSSCNSLTYDAGKSVASLPPQNLQFQLSRLSQQPIIELLGSHWRIPTTRNNAPKLSSPCHQFHTFLHVFTLKIMSPITWSPQMEVLSPKLSTYPRCQNIQGFQKYRWNIFTNWVNQATGTPWNLGRLACFGCVSEKSLQNLTQSIIFKGRNFARSNFI